MRILYITLEDLSLHKGSVVHIKEIVSGLRERGHRVDLVASSSNKDGEGPYFYNLTLMSPFILRLFRIKKQPYLFSMVFLFLYLFKILPQFDIIYARDFHTVMVALLPRILFKKKVVFEINGIAHEEQRLKSDSVFNRFFVFFIRLAEKIATKYCESIISVTSQIKTYLIQHFNCPPNKVKVVPNGVNTKTFYPIYDQILLQRWKEKLGISKDEIVIAFIGNLAPWQGVNVLIESALHLLAKKEGLKFLIVGEGLLRYSLISKVDKSGFSKSFIFTGMVKHDDIPFLINIADICVAPFVPQRNARTGTGSPIKLFEYMACGKPIVSSKFNGLEFIEEEGLGRLVEPGDVKDLEKVLEILINATETRENMGLRGNRMAREQYDWDSSVDMVEKILLKMA